MFESLSDKLQGVFKKLANRGKLSEGDVDAALREVRLALLEADVNYKVTKDFVARVRERAVGAEVMRSLTPAQQVVKIVNEELVTTLGAPAKLDLSGSPPHVVMLVGLQGSGKTTTAAKLALKLRRSGQRPLLVAADTRRPAAITQLEVLGQQVDIPVHSEGTEVPPPVICVNALKRADDAAYSAMILDTAGRLHIDDQLMAELEKIKRKVLPSEESFQPDRLASRILGMGDVLTLIEKAEAALDQEQALAMGKKLIQGEFNLEDFLGQLREIKKMGPLSQLLEMIPGFSQLKTELTPELTDRQMKMVEAIINSMTVEERRSPRIINASRKRRIARGSGTTVQDVNMLLVQFRQMQRMVKQLTSGRQRGLLSMFR